MVLTPPVRDGVLTVKQLPAIILCKLDPAVPQLAAFAFRSRPLPALVGGIPWKINAEFQAFVFPELDAGSYQFVVCDARPPYVALQMVRLRVRQKVVRQGARSRAMALAGGAVEITIPLSGTSSANPVLSSGIARADNPANIRTEMQCANGHVFPPGGNAPPDFTSGQMWFKSFTINENPLHNPFLIRARDSLGNSDEQDNITVSGMPMPTPTPSPILPTPSPAPSPLLPQSRQRIANGKTRKRSKVST